MAYLRVLAATFVLVFVATALLLRSGALTAEPASAREAATCTYGSGEPVLVVLDGEPCPAR